MLNTRKSGQILRSKKRPHPTLRSGRGSRTNSNTSYQIQARVIEADSPSAVVNWAHRACVGSAAATRKGGLRQLGGSRRSLGQRAGGLFSPIFMCEFWGYPRLG